MKFKKKFFNKSLRGMKILAAPQHGYSMEKKCCRKKNYATWPPKKYYIFLLKNYYYFFYHKMSSEPIFVPNGEVYSGVIHVHRLKMCLGFVLTSNRGENEGPYSEEMKELAKAHLLFLEILDIQLESKVWNHDFATYGKRMTVKGVLVLHDQYTRRVCGFSPLKTEETWALAEKFVNENRVFIEELIAINNLNA